MASDFDDMQPAEGADLDEGAHLDAFRVADADPVDQESEFIAVDQETGEAVAVDQGPEVMGLDAWQATWETAWNVPGLMVPKFAPLGITPEKRGASNAAAQAVYELAQDHFPWMIEAQGGVFGAVLAIGPFAVMQLGALRQIKAEELRAQEPANDPGAPPEPGFKSTRGSGLDWMDGEPSIDNRKPVAQAS